MLIPMGLLAQQNRERVWDVDINKYSNTMVMVVQVYYEGVLDPSLELGAFCDDECRGIAVSNFEVLPNNYFWYMNIQGESNNSELLSFYVRRNGEELDVVTSYSLYFEIDGVYGNVPNAVPINFESVSSSYYMLITDDSQLVPGRNYLIANGFDGDVMAMGLDNDGDRGASELQCVNNKTNTVTAYNNADGNAFEFTLDGSADAWTFYDGINDGYLTAGRRGSLLVKSSVTEAGNWVIDMEPTGALTIYNERMDYYMLYDDEEGEPAFYCGDESTLYLFAKCELVQGTMSSLPIADATKMFVVESGKTLTVDNLSTVDVSNLILENGAQLINASPNVQATMQKAINGYADMEVSDGWYTIATPMAASEVEVGSNLVFSEYDLYAYDETNLTNEEWRNYKNNAQNHFTSFEEGRGYLYANGTSFTPVFKGVLNNATVSFPLTYTDARIDNLKGLNLIGNPFPHNIYKGAGGAIDDSHLASGYYVLNDDAAWMAQTYDTPILPGQGILVKTNAAVTIDIAKTNAGATREMTSLDANSTRTRIDLNVSNGEVQDVAYLYLGSGNNLTKIEHLSATNPALSVVQDDNRYAIAHLDEQQGSIDLRFDNKLASTFTLAVNPEDWRGGYLHLIDHIAGTETDLLRSPSYTFATTGTEHPFRFTLLFGQADEDGNAPFAFYYADQIHILNQDAQANLQVVDMTGRIVMNGEAASCVSTSGLAQGVYVLRLSNGDVVRTQKVVIN